MKKTIVSGSRKKSNNLINIVHKTEHSILKNIEMISMFSKKFKYQPPYIFDSSNNYLLDNTYVKKEDIVLSLAIGSNPLIYIINNKKTTVRHKEL